VLINRRFKLDITLLSFWFFRRGWFGDLNRRIVFLFGSWYQLDIIRIVSSFSFVLRGRWRWSVLCLPFLFVLVLVVLWRRFCLDVAKWLVHPILLLLAPLLLLFIFFFLADRLLGRGSSSLPIPSVITTRAGGSRRDDDRGRRHGQVRSFPYNLVPIAVRST
jgi:fatty acid desaturase